MGFTYQQSRKHIHIQYMKAYQGLDYIQTVTMLVYDVSGYVLVFDVRLHITLVNIVGR